MNTKITGICIMILGFLCLDSTGQDMLGTVLGNHAGINSVQVNPSALHNSISYFDFQLLGADFFLENNYVYVARKDYRFTHFFQSGYQLPQHAESYGTESRLFYAASDKRDKNAFADIRIDGPGMMLIWGKHAFALTTDIRNIQSAHNVPYDIANFSYLGLNYKPQQNTNYIDKYPFRVASMSWAEIGLTYANEIYARGINKFSAGITVRRLFGFAGMYENTKNINYVIPNDSTINVKNLDAQFALALPLNYSDNTYNGNNLVLGHGFGFDLGVTYYRLARVHQESYSTQLCARPYEDYQYRIGIALIDVGAIKFNTNAQQYAINNKGSYWDNVTQLKFNNVQQLLDTISYKFYGNSTTAYQGNQFLLWLPAALSVQFDYHYRQDWYINSSLIYGFNISPNSLYRPAVLAVTPRYETDWFEVNLPVSLYDWYLPRIGLSLRIYYLTVGTEKLGEFFHIRDLTGMDFYFSIKYFLKKGSCRSAKSEGCKEKNFQIKSKF